MVAATLVSCVDEDGRAFACNQHVFFFVDIDAFLRKDGNIAIIRCLPTLKSEEGNRLKVSALAA